MVAEPAESMLGLESFEFRLPKTRYQRKLERLGLTSSRSQIDKGELYVCEKHFKPEEIDCRKCALIFIFIRYEVKLRKRAVVENNKRLSTRQYL